MLRLKRLMLPLCVLLAACAGTREAERSPTLAHVPTQTLPDGHVAVLVREYDDEVKLDGGREQRMHVRYLWDYTAAMAREIQTTPDGALLSDTTEKVSAEVELSENTVPPSSCARLPTKSRLFSL